MADHETFSGAGQSQVHVFKRRLFLHNTVCLCKLSLRFLAKLNRPVGSSASGAGGKTNVFLKESAGRR